MDLGDGGCHGGFEPAQLGRQVGTRDVALHRCDQFVQRGAAGIAAHALEQVEKCACPVGVPIFQGLPQVCRLLEQGLREVREEAERRAVVRVMARVNGNVARAAEVLGISRPTLYDLMNRFGLKKEIST